MKKDSLAQALEPNQPDVLGGNSIVFKMGNLDIKFSEEERAARQAF